MRSVIRQAKTVEEAVNQALKILSIDKDSAVVEVLEKPESGFLGIFGAKDAVVKVTVKEEDIVADIINDVFKSPKDEPETRDEDTLESSLSSSQTFHQDEDLEVVIQSEDIDYAKDQGPEDGVFEEGFHDSGIDIVDEDVDQVIVDKEEEEPEAYVLLQRILEGMDIRAGITYSLRDNDIDMEIVDIDQRDISIIIGKRGDTLDAIQYILNLAENRSSKAYKRIYLDVSNYRSKRKNSLTKLAKNMAKKAKSQNRDIRLEPMNAYERKIIHSVLQDDEDIETFSEGKEPRRRLVIKVKDPTSKKPD